jgi:hypothetical protein
MGMAGRRVSLEVREKMQIRGTGEEKERAKEEEEEGARGCGGKGERDYIFMGSTLTGFP